MDNKQNYLPPGQFWLDKSRWPVLSIAESPKFNPDTWKLSVYGQLNNPKDFTWEEFNQLPKKKIIRDMHCVTKWSIKDMEWEGVDFYELMKIVNPNPYAISVTFKANDEPGYTTSIRLNMQGKLFIHDPQKPEKEIELNDVLLAIKVNGEDISLEHGGPMRIIVPDLYAWKGTKHCTEIIFMNEHKIGFWEEYGYSDTAYPPADDRYDSPGAQKAKAKIYREARLKQIAASNYAKASLEKNFDVGVE